MNTPINKLPESPKKIFAGCKFHLEIKTLLPKKAAEEPKTQMVEPQAGRIEKTVIVIAPNPKERPSKPSIKLNAFINVIPKNIIQKLLPNDLGLDQKV